jgi:hypothetical protein
MEIIVAMVAFFALVASWFVLPASPPLTRTETVPQSVPEAMPSAA